MKMEEQITPSVPASASIPPTIPTITPEMVEQMKARAREEAIRITMEQRQSNPAPQLQLPTAFQRTPQVVYVRRNLTVAELILTVFLACGIVLGVQAGWNFCSKLLPRIEIKVK
jgi:hypothetical protein